MTILNQPFFHDEAAAYAKLESVVWPRGPVCPHCGNREKVYAIKGKTARPGLKTCSACRNQFTVKVGTVFESSHIPLHKWLQAAFLMASSKKGISAHQLHRTLEVTYKTAWFMAHRLREAMRESKFDTLGGDAKSVEVDETFIGRKPGLPKKRGYAHKEAVLSLIERGGRLQSRHVPSVNASTLKPILKRQIRVDSILMTDESGYYKHVRKEFQHHFAVNHGLNEYVRGGVHTNTVENYFPFSSGA